ncbi:MFS transporter [Demequina capsici]|uniref:MFS transporter n=1 Tax=Demequina capsici TaxID=3075620 RepID=A0AA96F8P5_9MICO|nr:MFS transporter [Demequina sp. OYTSA14]WNM23765.1 MFS transporter [Demequina sp. OYTSA14]
MTISDEAAVIAEPLDDSTRITSEFGSPRKTIGLVLVAALGMYVMAMSMSTALSLRIASVAPDTKDVIYSRTVAIGALLMLVVIPLAGALSDRTTSRFGRRRPWIAGGLVVALVTALIAGISPNPIVIGASYVVLVTAMQSSFNAYAVIPVEAVPDAMRARVMGIMGLFGALAFSGGSYLTGALVGQPVLLMTAPVLLAVLTVAPLLALYRDPIKAKAEVPALDVKNLFGGLIVNPRKHPNFGWTWLARLLAGIAMASLFTYFIYYMIDVLQVPLPEVGAKAGLLTLISAPISVIFFTGSGWLSDKVGRRKPFVAVAAVLMAAALVLGAGATSFVTFAIAWSIFAMGQAIYLTVDLALCASVLPNAKDAGKDMAVFGLALNIPNIIVPAVGPTVLALGGGQNYSLLWIAAAVLCLVGAGLMPLIRGVR